MSISNNKINKEAYVRKHPVSNKSRLLFKRKNYIILIIAISILFFGFFLLSGGGTEDYEYNKSIFNFQRQVLAPTLIIASLVLCAVSIMLKK